MRSRGEICRGNSGEARGSGDARAVRFPNPWLTQVHTIHRVVQVNLRHVLLRGGLLGLASAALLAIPFVLYQRAEVENNLKLTHAEQERVVRLAAGTIRQEMDAVLSDLRYLSQHDELSRYLAQPGPDTRLDLAREYRAFALQKHLYDEIALVGPDGREQVRVDFNRGSPLIALPQALRDRSGAAWFARARALPPSRIHVSSLEPGDAQQNAGESPRPVIRFAIPVADAGGTVRGVVVLGYLGERLRNKLAALEGHAGTIRVFDSQGNVVVGAGAQGEWGFMHPDRGAPGLPAELPALWAQMQRAPSGVLRTPDAWIRHDRIRPLLGEDAVASGAARAADAGRYQWTVAVERPQATVRTENRALLSTLWAVYGVLAAVAMLVAGAFAFAFSRNQALSRVMEQVVDSVPVLVAYVDAGERYRFNNMAYARFFGLNPRQIYGKSIRELLGDVTYEKARPYIARALAGEAVSFERQLAFAGAGPHDVVVSYLPDASPRGEVNGFYVMVNDVSEIRASQRRERQQLHEMAHVSRLASMGEMATEIAHEINQPLAAISMYSAAGLRGLQDGCDAGKLENLLGSINTQAKRASEIVKRVRRFVQKGEPQLGPVDMNQIARDTVALVDHDARVQDIAVDLALAPALPVVQGERVLLEQVVFNLVRNAMDAVLAGTGARRVTLRTRSDAQQVYVEVFDTGPGVDPALGDQIFDSFVTGRQGGLGMGLAISRSIVEAHGGQLRYAACPEGGTVFSFSLPREAA
jgi:PAS domain S-box-containing protein